MTCENFITKRKSPFETNQNGLYFFAKKIVNLGSVYNEIGSHKIDSNGVFLEPLTMF